MDRDGVPEAINTVICAPDDGWCHPPKLVEQFTAINKLYVVAFLWKIINIKPMGLLRNSKNVIFL
jgi:hypothetical protein